MAATVNELITRVRITGDDRYIRQVHRMADAQQRLVSRAFHVGLGYSKIAIAGLGAAITGMAFASVRSAMEFDSLMRGLTAVMGSASAARKELTRLIEVAKLPGLGFLEAIEASTAFQAAGFTAAGAARAIMAFGNALATVGRGKADFQLVALALTQIATKSVVSGQEIRQLAERIPQIRRVMLQAFGTADTEELAKMGVTPERFLTAVIEELEKLPRVVGGARNAWENFLDSFTRLRVVIGTSLLKVITPALEGLSDVMERVVQAGLLERMMSGIGRFGQVGGIADLVKRSFLGVLAVLQAMPDIVRQIGTWFQRYWGPVRILVAGIAAIMAVMFTGNVITSIVTFGKAVIGLVAYMVKLIATLFTAKVLSGQWAQALAGVAAGIAVFAVLTRGLGGMKDMLGGLTDAFSTNPIMRRYQELMQAFGGTQTMSSGFTGALADRAEQIISPLPGGALGQIAEHTRQTAENTQPLERLNRMMLGGGDLGRIGITPVEVAGFGRRGGGVTVNIYGGDPAEIERTILNLRRRGLV